MIPHTQVLVVDDNEETRQNLRDILELEGYEVALAGTSVECRALLESKKPHVVLLDRKLPDGLADELLPELRGISSRSAFVIVTGYADLESSIRSLRNGAADYLLKPVNPAALLTVIRRLIELRQIQHELHEEHQFAERVLRTAETIVVVIGLDGKVLRCSPHLAKSCGLTLEECIQKDWFETFLLEVDRERFRQHFRQAMAGIESKGLTSSLRTKRGPIRQMRWSSAPLTDEFGSLMAVLSIGLDVSDLVAAQERALHSERLATIGQTMAAIAHESRNALQRIQASAELLELELEGNAQATNDLKSIFKAANDLHGLLEEVRMFAAPMQLELEKCDLRALWRRVWEQVRSAGEERDAELVENVVRPLHLISVDKNRMAQVFRNLFENSLEASQGSVRIDIDYHAVEELDSVEIVISDDGTGFQQEALEKAFDPFFTTKTTGTGLGLSIVRRIIDAHQGTIQIANRPSGGAVYSILLPSHPSMKQVASGEWN